MGCDPDLFSPRMSNVELIVMLFRHAIWSLEIILFVAVCTLRNSISVPCRHNIDGDKICLQAMSFQFLLCGKGIIMWVIYNWLIVISEFYLNCSLFMLCAIFWDLYCTALDFEKVFDRVLWSCKYVHCRNQVKIWLVWSNNDKVLRCTHCIRTINGVDDWLTVLMALNQGLILCPLVYYFDGCQ